MAASQTISLAKFLDLHLKKVRTLTNVIVILVFALMVLVVFSQVIWRFVFNNPFPWSEEVARNLQVWLILLASVAGIRKGKHLAVDYFSQIMSFKVAKVLKLTSIVCILLFTIVLFFASIHLLKITLHQVTPATRLPIMVVYLAFPVSSLLMFLESLIVFLNILNVKDRKDMKALEGEFL